MQLDGSHAVDVTLTSVNSIKCCIYVFFGFESARNALVSYFFNHGGCRSVTKVSHGVSQRLQELYKSITWGVRA